MTVWYEDRFTHKVVPVPEVSVKHKQQRKAPTVSIDNNVRTSRFAAVRRAAYIKGRAETYGRNLKALPLDGKSTTPVIQHLDFIDRKITAPADFAAALEKLHELARDPSAPDTAYAAAVALSATTLRDVHRAGDKHVKIDMAVFPGTMIDLHAVFSGIFVRPPPPGDAGKNSLAYMLLKALPFRCWTRKSGLVMKKKLVGPSYSNILRPKESEMMQMADASVIRTVMYRWLLCSLLGNYEHCAPSSRPSLAQRKLLVAALDKRSSTAAETPVSIAIARGLMERAPNLQKLVTREYIVHMIGEDASLEEYARSVCNWPKMRLHTIETMNSLRVSVGKWVEQVLTSDGDALFASIKSIKFARFDCSYKKAAVPPLFAITADIGKHAAEKADLERESDSDDPGGAEDKDGFDWASVLETVDVINADTEKLTFNEYNGLHSEYARRMITYVRALPADLSQEDFCRDHVPLLLRVCGAPEVAIRRVSDMFHRWCIHRDDIKKLPKRIKVAETQALRSAFPHTMRLLTSLRAIWQRHGITRFSLPRQYLVNQCRALNRRFGLESKVKPDSKEDDIEIVTAPEEATKFTYCETCREIYTIIHQHRSSQKQVYRDGLRDAQVETQEVKGALSTAGRPWCKSNGSFGHERCQDHPLTEICMLGKRICWFTGESYMICLQPDCGQPFAIDPAHNLMTEFGIACNECSMTIEDRHFQQQYVELVDAYTSIDGYKCDFPGCGKVQRSETGVAVFGNLYVCSLKRHNRIKCAKFLRQTLPGHVLRNPHLKEHDDVIYQQMRQFKAEEQVRTAARLKVVNKRFKAQEARDRQKQRR